MAEPLDWVWQELRWQMSHNPAVVAAQGPGAAAQLLAVLLFLPAERASVLDTPHLSPKPAGNKPLILRLPLLPESPKRNLTKPWKECKCCKVSGQQLEGEEVSERNLGWEIIPILREEKYECK